MKAGFRIVALALLFAVEPIGAAEEKPAPPPAESKKPVEPPKAEQSVTQHSLVIGGVALSYTATAGTQIVRNGKDEPYAAIGYTAYVKKDADPSRRPITFAYNGGPGSSSVWLHMGALGPKRIATSNAGPTPPPPYKVVDNAESILDRTDLVMIDPVGTGYSHAVGDAKDKDFWGADPDIESISRFISQFISDNGRWNSPKYLLGESYGSTRSAGIVDYLETRSNMAFNGVILVSVALDLEAIFNLPANDRPYPLFLPTYAAVAWFHGALANKPAKLEPFLAEVRAFATGPYTAALEKGHDQPAAERAEIVRKLHEYTGLSAEYLEKSDLRVDEGAFTQELLRGRRATVGRLDSRFLGYMFDPLEKQSDYDPQVAAIASAYTAAFLDYYNRELKFGQGKTYTISNSDLFPFWDFKHKPPGSPFAIPSLTNTAPDLAHAMGYDPSLRVLALNGYYDLATPFLATEYTMSHLGLDSSLQPRIEMKYYEAGHMMYVHEPSLKAMKADVADFIDRTSRVR